MSQLEVRQEAMQHTLQNLVSLLQPITAQGSIHAPQQAPVLGTVPMGGGMPDGRSPHPMSPNVAREGMFSPGGGQEVGGGFVPNHQYSQLQQRPGTLAPLPKTPVSPNGVAPTFFR